MKKIGKLNLVAATAAVSVLHAAGISDAIITQQDKKMIISIGKGSSKQTILQIKQKDLLALSSKTISATLDPQTWMMSFNDPFDGKLIFSAKINKKLFAKKVKEPISIIISYAKKHLTMQLSKNSVPSSVIMISSDTKKSLSEKRGIGEKISMKMKNGKLFIAKQAIDLHSTIGSLIGCTDTDCKIHSKHAASIAANNPHYEKMLKKTAGSFLGSNSQVLLESFLYIKKELIKINS